MCVGQQSFGQIDQGLHLGAAGWAMIKVTYKAYTYAVFVVFVAVVGIDPCMGSVFLFAPPGADLDLAISRIRTITDNEVIAHFVPAVVFV